MPRPAVSVVVTSDYASGKPAGWDDLRASLAALARQDFRGPAEFLLVETAELAPRIPADVLRTLPSLRIVSADARAASALKNAGARAASADIVALIDGDCRAARGWLRHLVSALRDHPEVGVVSGRTTYGDETRFARMMALITRSFLDVGRTAPTAHVTINNAGFRRSTLLAHPLPDATGAHMSMLQSEAIARAGGRFLFEPRMHVTHSYGGWAMEKEIRRSMGYGVITVRRLGERIRYAALARLGYASIPAFVLLRMLHSCRNCVRSAGDYGVSWWELPIAFLFAARACMMEAAGMMRAVRDLPHGPSEFR